ncbi:MAG TPA: deoxyguanosinetriphosphate triphosphohydrolase [Xanthobacteraceae bacterium]|nr:deoxyguanosinetriphosphate triphosphohydrolase [Xanthobacteraceae bacterium]
MAVETGRERAAYAAHPGLSRGRRFAEPESAARNVFRRDCDRVIHSTAFRRLKHKTQVFIVHEGDHYRTRLTHTLEVTQIARSLARSLGLDEDLAEALALAHDLGHPPFGHAGEQALDQCLAECGGFDHNVQTLRVVTRLERRYAAFDGLNLTWETLEGLIKHNGPLTNRDGRPSLRYAGRGVPAALTALLEDLAIPSWTQGTAEAQAAAIADDIAYDAHDIDDGLRAGFFDLSDLADVAFLGDIMAEARKAHPGIDPTRLAHELVRRLITRMIEDVVSASDRRLAELPARSAEDVRCAPEPLVAFSPALAEADRAIKAFLYPRMYRHPRIVRVTSEAKEVVHNLFCHFSARPETLPPDWRQGFAEEPETARARRIGDFIAGMTDNFALAEHARYFDSTPDLR